MDDVKSTFDILLSGMKNSFFLLGVCISSVTFAFEPDYTLQAPSDYDASTAKTLDSERIDPFSGRLHISYEDMRLPATGGMDIVINRVYGNLENPHTRHPYATTVKGRSSLGPGWDIHFGRIWTYRGVRIAANDDPRACRVLPTNGMQDKSPVFELSTGSREVLLDSSWIVDDDPMNSPVPASFVTKNFSWASCLPESEDLEDENNMPIGGLVVTTADGKRYKFNEYGKVLIPGPMNQFSTHAYLPTEIMDNSGNKLIIKYRIIGNDYKVIDYVKSVAPGASESSEGPKAVFDYDASNYLLLSITSQDDANIKVEYEYEPFLALVESPFHLKRAVLPEGHIWHYTYTGIGSDGAHSIQRITSPLGIETEYEYGKFFFSVAPSIGFFSCPEDTCENVVVTKKTLSGNVEEAEFLYQYSTSFQENDVTKVVHSGYSCIQYEHEGENKNYPVGIGATNNLHRRGLLVRKTVYDSDDCDGSILRYEVYEYDDGEKIKISNLHEYRPYPYAFSDSVWNPVLTKKIIHQNDTIFTSEYSNFTSSGSPERIEDYQSGMPRRITIREVSNFPFWKNYGRNLSGVITEESVFESSSKVRDYELTMGGNLLPLIENTDGVKKYFDTNNRGEVERIINAYTTNSEHIVFHASDFHRGTPEKITTFKKIGNGTSALISPDIVRERIIDNMGNVKKETLAVSGDPNSAVVTEFSYDDMGRLTFVKTPRDVDDDIHINYAINSTGYKTVYSRGGLSTARQYNGAGALLKEEVYSGTTNIKKKFRVDELNRQVFASFPTYGSLDTVGGVVTTYDNLGRVKRVSVSGGGEKTYVYRGSLVSANQVRISDEEGFVTLHTYKSYGDPSEQFLVKIEQQIAGNDYIETNISRNAWRISGIEQDGYSHSFSYFSDKLSQIETESRPEIGMVRYERYDDGLVKSRQVFNIDGSEPLSEKTQYFYDYQRRPVLTLYPGYTQDLLLAYDKFGNVAQAEVIAPTWDWLNCYLNVAGSWHNDTICSALYNKNLASYWEYGHDDNGNLVDELLFDSISNKSYAISYGYDSRDSLSEITYPSGDVLSYSPDDFGRPTGMTLSRNDIDSTIVSSVAYHPNGQLQTMSLANGRSVSVTQNQRLLPEQFSVTGDILDLGYSYDDVGNIVDISDGTSGSLNARSYFAYDGVSRLISVTYPDDIVHQFEYNKRGDITQKTVGSDIWSYTYDIVTKRLAQTATTAKTENYTYDHYGNTLSVGTVNYQYDDASRMLSASPLPNYVEYYRYDANGRRMSVRKGNNYHISLYGQKGKLISEIDNQGSGNYRNYLYLEGALVAHDDNCTGGSDIALNICGWVDYDGDGLSYDEERAIGTDPYLADTDNDGLSDGYEWHISGTNPLQEDSDGDGMIDGVEIAYGSDPLVADIVLSRVISKMNDFSIKKVWLIIPEFSDMGSNIWVSAIVPISGYSKGLATLSGEWVDYEYTAEHGPSEYMRDHFIYSVTNGTETREAYLKIIMRSAEDYLYGEGDHREIYAGSNNGAPVRSGKKDDILFVSDSSAYWMAEDDGNDIAYFNDKDSEYSSASILAISSIEDFVFRQEGCDLRAFIDGKNAAMHFVDWCRNKNWFDAVYFGSDSDPYASRYPYLGVMDRIVMPASNDMALDIAHLLWNDAAIGEFSGLDLQVDPDRLDWVPGGNLSSPPLYNNVWGVQWLDFSLIDPDVAFQFVYGIRTDNVPGQDPQPSYHGIRVHVTPDSGGVIEGISGAGAELILGSAGSDSLAGRDGHDHIVGQGGEDTVLMAKMDGNDTVDLMGESSLGATLHLSDVSDTEITLDRSGLDMIVSITNGGSARFERFYANSSTVHGIYYPSGLLNFKEVTFGVSGLPLSKSDAVSLAIESSTLTGTSGPDTLLGTAGNDVIFGRAGADILEGSEGDDVLYGEADNDTLDGGSGNDYLYGDEGDDILILHAGHDYLHGGSGQDTYLIMPNVDETPLGFIDNLDLTTGPESSPLQYDRIRFGEDVLPEHVTFNRVGLDLWIRVDALEDGSAEVVIPNYFRDSWSELHFDFVDSVEQWNGSCVDYVQNPVLCVKNRVINDMIANHAPAVYAYGENDIIVGHDWGMRIYGAGSDEHLTGGSGDDHIYGGMGNDVLIGGDGDDELYPGWGNDYVSGGNGNDRLYGGDWLGLSILEGNAGDDTYLIADADSRTRILDIDASIGSDTLHYTGSREPEQLWFYEADVDGDGFVDDLIIEVIGETNTVQVMDWKQGNNQLQKITLNAGNCVSLARSDLIDLVPAMLLVTGGNPPSAPFDLSFIEDFWTLSCP